MKTKLITALRAAASALEQDRFNYNWNYAVSCNCGVLACALTGHTPKTLVPHLPEIQYHRGSGTWTKRLAAYCPIIGQTNHALIKTLFSFGLTQDDMINLEYLDDQEVIKRIPRKRLWYTLWRKRRKLDYHKKADVVLYLRAWADLLQEQGAMDTAEFRQAPPSTARPTPEVTSPLNPVTND